MNLDHTVRGRVASYVWGPDVGSSWTGQSSWQQAGGVGGLLMVIDGVATSPHSGTTWDPIDDDYVDSLAPHARLALRAAVGSLPRLPPVALVPLMDRMGNVTGYKKAHTSVPAAQLDAIYDYDAFGKEIRSTGPAADIVPYHFSTKRVDSTTGLVYYGYRWYDPAKGRWLSRDPIGENTHEPNMFGFVSNKTCTSLDKLSLEAQWIPLLDTPPDPGDRYVATQGGYSRYDPKWDTSYEGDRCDDTTAQLKSFEVKTSISINAGFRYLIMRPKISIEGHYGKLQIRYFSCWADKCNGYRHQYDNKMAGSITIGAFGSTWQINHVRIRFLSCECGIWTAVDVTKPAQIHVGSWGVGAEDPKGAQLPYEPFPGWPGPR